MAKKAEEKTAKVMDDRARALETTLASLEKQFGKGTVMKLGEQAHMKVDVVPTGCLELDLALGVGGIPKGRIIEVFRPDYYKLSNEENIKKAAEVTRAHVETYC